MAHSQIIPLKQMLTVCLSNYSWILVTLSSSTDKMDYNIGQTPFKNEIKIT